MINFIPQQVIFNDWNRPITIFVNDAYNKEMTIFDFSYKTQDMYKVFYRLHENYFVSSNDNYNNAHMGTNQLKSMKNLQFFRLVGDRLFSITDEYRHNKLSEIFHESVKSLP